MVPIVIVAHAPLASALLEVARHAYADRVAQVRVVDVPASAVPEQAQAMVAASLAAAGAGPALILADAFGATPTLAARSVAEQHGARVVTGVNVPMLWRTLCYHQVPLDELVSRALEGGKMGIMPATTTPPQNQSLPASPQAHDQDPGSHQ